MPSNQRIDFRYNSDGIRTYKYFIDNDEMCLYQHDYMLEGSTIVGEKVYYFSYFNGVWTKYKYYYYDENGSPIGMGYEGKDYYFQKNILGDIEAIYQGSTKVVQYTYDAWGNVLSVTGTLASTIGQENPFRYRGYYYDTETGLYYLQSRYYDPQVGRFINADRWEILISNEFSLIQNNLYAYCWNNIVNMIDSLGEAPAYIDNQRDPKVRDIKWGLFGNTAANGCGWISVYNVMVTYSNKVTHKSVINGLSAAGGVLALGKLGARPDGITRYLKSKFFFVKTHGPITYFWGILAERSGAIIVLYQHKGWNSSLHYVAGIKTGEGVGGLFRFYNDPNYYTKRYGQKSISIWRYIELLREKGCKLVMMWGIALKMGRW